VGPAEAAGGRGGRRLAQQHHVRLRGSAHERRSGESPLGSGNVKYLLCLPLSPPPPPSPPPTPPPPPQWCWGFGKGGEELNGQSK